MVVVILLQPIHKKNLLMRSGVSIIIYDKLWLSDPNNEAER